MEQHNIATVWAELTMTDDGFTVNLLSEGRDGTRVEDQLHVPIEEVKTGSSPKSLSLSAESRGWLAGRNSGGVDVLSPTRPSIEAGQRLVDPQSPHWSATDEVEVKEEIGIPAYDFVIDYDEHVTVADKNPEYPEDDLVVAARPIGSDGEPIDQVYHYPASRLEDRTQNMV